MRSPESIPSAAVPVLAQAGVDEGKERDRQRLVILPGLAERDRISLDRGAGARGRLGKGVTLEVKIAGAHVAGVVELLRCERAALERLEEIRIVHGLSPGRRRRPWYKCTLVPRYCPLSRGRGPARSTRPSAFRCCSVRTPPRGPCHGRPCAVRARRWSGPSRRT